MNQYQLGDIIGYFGWQVPSYVGVIVGVREDDRYTILFQDGKYHIDFDARYTVMALYSNIFREEQ